MPLTSRNGHQYDLSDRPAVSQKRHQELSIMTHKLLIEGQQAPALRPLVQPGLQVGGLDSWKFAATLTGSALQPGPYCPFYRLPPLRSP